MSSLNRFYNTTEGRILTLEISRSIKSLIDIKNDNLLMMGIGGKYLNEFDYDKSFYAIPMSYPFEHWPRIRPFKTVVVDEKTLPFMPNSMGAIIVIHFLEFSKKNPELLQDIFRVFKTRGKLIVISANKNDYNIFHKNNISKKYIKHNINEVINFISDASFCISNIFGINQKLKFWPYTFNYSFSKYNKALISFFPFLSDVVVIVSEKIEPATETIKTLDTVPIV